jgi:hypothetical protein
MNFAQEIKSNIIPLSAGSFKLYQTRKTSIELTTQILASPKTLMIELQRTETTRYIIMLKIAQMKLIPASTQDQNHAIFDNLA